MDKSTDIILNSLNEGHNIINNAYPNKCGYKTKDEYYNKLHELKRDGLVNFKECEHVVFKGEPSGEITITAKGKEYLANNK